jgi:hypothetical protein
MFYDEYDIENYENIQFKIETFIGVSKTLDIHEYELNQIEIGDKIIVYYYPFSQKYIYNLYPKYGIVTNIKYFENQLLDLNSITLKNDTNEYSANQEGVGLYSRGFDVVIKKIISN